MQQAVGQFGGRLGSKLTSAVVLMMATRFLDFDTVGVVFFAEASAGVLLPAVDFGLFRVLFRRTARGQMAQRTLAHALLVRTVGLVVVGALYVVAVRLLSPEQSVPLVGFFITRGIVHIHQVGRAVLAGRERFILNAVLGVGSRLIGTAVIVIGFVSGWGLWGWLIGQLIAEVLQLVAVLLVAHRELRGVTQVHGPMLVREGLPMWGTSVLAMIGTRINLLVLTSRYGFQDGGFFGLANRIISGALMVVSALSTVAFPAMARERRPVITRLQLLVVGVLALGMGFAVWILAPFAIRVVTGSEPAAMVLAVRILAVAVVLGGIEKPASDWALAKDREQALLWMAGIAEFIGLLVMVALVVNYGLIGAAIAVNVHAALKLLGAGAVVLDTVRRPATAS